VRTTSARRRGPGHRAAQAGEASSASPAARTSKPPCQTPSTTARRAARALSGIEAPRPRRRRRRARALVTRLTAIRSRRWRAARRFSLPTSTARAELSGGRGDHRSGRARATRCRSWGVGELPRLSTPRRALPPTRGLVDRVPAVRIRRVGWRWARLQGRLVEGPCRRRGIRIRKCGTFAFRSPEEVFGGRVLETKRRSLLQRGASVTRRQTPGAGGCRHLASVPETTRGANAGRGRNARRRVIHVEDEVIAVEMWGQLTPGKSYAWLERACVWHVWRAERPCVCTRGSPWRSWATQGPNCDLRGLSACVERRAHAGRSGAGRARCRGA